MRPVLPVSTVATTTVTSSAVLSITKVALNDPVNAGGIALYQLVVVNNGPSDAQNVVVTDTLPVSTTYAGGDAACSANGQTVTCNVGTLAAGASRTLLVQAQVAALAVDGLTLTNVVTATSPTATTPVTAVVTSTVRQPTGGLADLSINKTGPASVTAGQRLTYTVVVTNNGPATAQDVQVVDALPAGTTLVAVTPSQGTCNAGVTCDLGSLAMGQTVTVVVTVTVDGATTGNLVNRVQASSSNPDTNLVNNTAAVTTTATAQVNLFLVKQVTPATARPGDLVFYQIVVTNTGPSTAQHVTVTDNLPAELVGPLVNSSQGGCTAFPCVVGDLPAGGSATVFVVATLATTATGSIANTAVVSTTTALTNAALPRAAQPR